MNAQLWPLILFPFHISSKPSTLFGIAMRAWARRKTNKALATDKARRAGEIAEQARADALCSFYCGEAHAPSPSPLAAVRSGSRAVLIKTNKALATDKARRAGEIAEQARADALCSFYCGEAHAPSPSPLAAVRSGSRARSSVPGPLVRRRAACGLERPRHGPVRAAAAPLDHRLPVSVGACRVRAELAQQLGHLVLAGGGRQRQGRAPGARLF